jgi:bifunctional non-homologous end joining protein LigD
VLLEEQLDGSALELVPVERLGENGMEEWAEVQRRGLEGLVAKPEASRYISGARGLWRKVKVRLEGVFVLAGIARDRDGHLMLIVGGREGRALRFAGTVGFGVTRRVVDGLYPRIEPLVRATSPFRDRLRFADCVWLEPRLCAEVTFAELVKGRLRDPVFRGIVRRPTPSGS